MHERTDRELLDQELIRYTASGWQIVSQSESGFQVMLPHTVSNGAVGLLVIAPMVLGVLASLLGSIVFGSALFSLALVLAALLALHHLTKRPQLQYITAAQLRAGPSSASVVRDPATGVMVCSICRTPSRTDATECAHCKASFIKA